MTWYNELKNQCLNYTKTIKDIQTFNQTLLKEIKDKFIITKKRYSQIPFVNNYLINGAPFGQSALFNQNMNSNALIEDSKNNFIDTNTMKDNHQSRLKTPKNELSNDNENNNFNTESSKKSQKKEKTSNEKLYKQGSPGIINLNESLNNSVISSGVKKEKVLFKLKDEEKNFYDKGNFRKDFTTEADVIQLNLFGKLFMLGGKNFNKFYYYDLPSNSIYYLNNTLYSHYYGSMVYCSKYNTIYLLGGNNQVKCEMCYLSNQNQNSNTEFATLYFDDYIYVFFGFNSKKGINLSSIERINVNTNSNFEVVYINEQINLSSLGCAHFIDDTENDKEKSNGILLLGGFDGENYMDSSLLFNPKEMKIRDCDIVIPNMSKHSQFLFHKESAFIEFDNGAQYVFDSQNNVHLLTNDSYELFSEAQ